MNLETWLKQSRPQGEQLGVIEALCTALNEAHLRGVVHPAIEPSNIDLASDGSVSLAEAVHGVSSSTGSRYRAPEVAEGSPHSAPADIYAAGVIFYEMLAGRPPAVGADRVTPLSDSRPDLSRDLTDAVMGCLERGPDWRPRDLGYLLQVVAQVRASGPSRAPTARPVRNETPRSAPAPSARPTTRATSRSRKDSDLPLSAARDTGGRSSLPMILVALVVLAGGGVGAWVWLQSDGKAPRVTPSARATVTPPPAIVATAQPAASPTPSGVAALPQTQQLPLPPPTPSAPLATPLPTEVSPTPTPVPTLVPVAIATPPPPRVPTPAPTPTAQATDAQPSTVAAATPVPAAAVEPAMLTAVTPLTLKRGVQSMIDIRGMALRSDQQIRITHMKERGVSIPIRRVKWVDATLMKALVDMDPNLPTGQYAVAVLDPQGGVTNALVITITK